MIEDRKKWNHRYGSEGFYLGPEPSDFLVDSIELIKSLVPGWSALDIACGEGRNSIYLAKQGFSVTGMDISEEGLAKGDRWARREGLEIKFSVVDLEVVEFIERYDLIVNFNFLLRGLIPKMVDALNPGGLAVFDTILNTPSLEGTHKRNFLLEPGELRKIFSGFSGRIIDSHELDRPPMPSARLIFHKG
jgi:2-polyprenyl-3-methyl-5-hydroxy-6-metoxy-1,4-benzoquinol methylase